MLSAIEDEEDAEIVIELFSEKLSTVLKKLYSTIK